MLFPAQLRGRGAKTLRERKKLVSQIISRYARTLVNYKRIWLNTHDDFMETGDKAFLWGGNLNGRTRNAIAGLTREGFKSGLLTRGRQQSGWFIWFAGLPPNANAGQTLSTKF